MLIIAAPSSPPSPQHPIDQRNLLIVEHDYSEIINPLTLQCRRPLVRLGWAIVVAEVEPSAGLETPSGEGVAGSGGAALVPPPPSSILVTSSADVSLPPPP